MRQERTSAMDGGNMRSMWYMCAHAEGAGAAGFTPLSQGVCGSPVDKTLALDRPTKCSRRSLQRQRETITDVLRNQDLHCDVLAENRSDQNCEMKTQWEFCRMGTREHHCHPRSLHTHPDLHNQYQPVVRTRHLIHCQMVRNPRKSQPAKITD
jgi:hypothetical protein